MENSSHNSFIFRNRLLQKITLIAGGTVLITGIGIGAYYAFKKKNSLEYLICLVEKKKKSGNELFRCKEYKNALKVFKECIKLLSNVDINNKSVKHLIANCYNNISACCENLNKFEEAILNCSEAIKIDPKYFKALNRRARLYEKQGELKNAINDYFTLTSLWKFNDQLKALNSDVDRVLQLIVNAEIEPIIKGKHNVYKNIPQYIVANWLWGTTTNDPIVKRIKELTKNQESLGLKYSIDAALIIIKSGKYDQVLPTIEKIYVKIKLKIDDIETNLAEEEKFEKQKEKYFELGAAILLISRFYYYHNLQKEAHVYAKKFTEFFSNIENKIKNEMIDLQVAYFSLMATIAETVSDAAEFTEYSLTVAPENVDPLIVLACRLIENHETHLEAVTMLDRAEKIQPNNVYIKFYKLYLNYLIAFKQQDISQARTCIHKFDELLKNEQNPPIFALVLFVKLCINSENSQLALETTEKILMLMPNNIYALYFHCLLQCDNNLALNEPEKIKANLNSIETKIQSLLKIDPYYWEPYSALAKIYLDRMEFEKAMSCFDKGINLARTRQELEVLLREKIVTEITQKRIQNGHELSYLYSKEN